MGRFNFAFTASLVVIVAVLVACCVGCGGMGSSPNRVLESMTLSPSSADAQTFPQNQVQFTATGIFSRPPSPATVPFVAPYSGSWSVSDTNVATINQSGLAQCISGASGTVTVMATASSNSATSPGTGTAVAVSGTAMLTCP